MGPYPSDVETVLDTMTDENFGQFWQLLTLERWLGEVEDNAVIFCNTSSFISYVQDELGFTGCDSTGLHTTNVAHYTHGEPRPDQMARIRRVLAKHCLVGTPLQQQRRGGVI